jgi:PAS domain S-box-containing protein
MTLAYMQLRRRPLLASLVLTVAVASGLALLGPAGWREPLAWIVIGLAAGALVGVGSVLAWRRTTGAASPRAAATPDERLLDSIVENIPIATFVKDAETLRHVRVNRALEELVGLAREDMIGKSNRELFPPEQAASFEKDDRDVLSRGTLLDVPKEAIATPRGTRILHTKKIPIRDQRGTPVYLLGISEDVTERENAREERDRLLMREHAARRSAESAHAASESTAMRLRELLAITEIALAQVHLADVLQHVMRRIRNVFDVDTVAVVLLTKGGQELQVEAALGIDGATGLRFPAHVGLAARTLGDARAVMVDDLSQQELGNPLLGECGVRSVLAVPLRLGGRALGVLHTGTLALRRFSEDEAMLLQLVADRVAIAIDRSRTYEKERSAREEAQRAVRARDELLAVVSHDLRTPLNAIALSVSALRSRLVAPGDGASALRNADVIKGAVERMTRLIRDLLDAARIEAEGLPIERTRNDPRSILDEAVSAIRPIAEQKSLCVEVATSEAAPPVLCDRERILQAFENLLGNAVKFTPSGGTIRITLHPQDSCVVFCVADTGCGIPRDASSHVFDRYWRADRAQREGSGLGLYIAKGIVEGHGGRIWVESEEGAGARFFFSVPAAEALEVAAPS